MERCDFSSVTTLMRQYISDEHAPNQVDFLYELFASFMDDKDNGNFDFDNGLVCRWVKGQAKLSPRIINFYLKRDNQPKLIEDMENNILALMYDSAMAIQDIHDLLIRDSSISEKKKGKLLRLYPCRSEHEEAIFLVEILCFALERPFVKRDTQRKNLLASGGLSPVLLDYILDGEVPRPCRHFCGREEELEMLHGLLEKNRQVFLHGIAGIGKSELAKAYAKKYKKEYTNILYLTYTGSLKADITELYFADDLTKDNEEERFRKHNRFMRSLKEDTLLIVDNFNATAMQDNFLFVMLKYRCRILFTTRSQFDGQCSMVLEEIADQGALINLVGAFFFNAEKYRETIGKIIETVHSHTLGVELAARLLENGILEPNVLLQKLQEEKAALGSTDKISITKDGKASRETYYNHIHTLFSLYLLSKSQQDIMRNLALSPAIGIPARRFAAWLNLPDMNTVNDLIEMGFVQPKPGRSIALHPMVQEITVVDMKPSILRCQLLCRSIQEICLLHGLDVPYHKLLFQTVEAIVALAEKDGAGYYLRFLEDVFPYMEKYCYKKGMERILSEMAALLKQPIATSNDRALYLDYQATCEKKAEKAIKLRRDALNILTEVTTGNAHLAANLHANLGSSYRKINQIDLAKKHMEQGMSILKQHGLLHMNDSITQICNYAVLLTDIGDSDQGLAVLRELSMLVKEHNSDCCSDYALIQEALGGVFLVRGDVKQATEHFKQATQIYESMWEDEPELIEAKYQEILKLYPQAGIAMGKRLLHDK